MQFNPDSKKRDSLASRPSQQSECSGRQIGAVSADHLSNWEDPPVLVRIVYFVSNMPTPCVRYYDKEQQADEFIDELKRLDSLRKIHSVVRYDMRYNNEVM